MGPPQPYESQKLIEIGIENISSSSDETPHHHNSAFTEGRKQLQSVCHKPPGLNFKLLPDD